MINFELPRDPEIYIHRIRRTGRAGGEGLALSLFAPSEAYRINAIEEYLGSRVELAPLPSHNPSEQISLPTPMVTLCIDGGRKKKVRPGDILGALTANGALPGDKVGQIDIFDHVAYVAIVRSLHQKALRTLADKPLKGRSFKVRVVR